MRGRFLFAAVAASAFAGCSGGGGTSSIGSGSSSAGGAGGASGASSQTMSVSAVTDTNALGSPIKDFATFDKTAGSISGSVQTKTFGNTATTGTCHGGVEFFAPNKAGNADSTETIDFYDTACTIEARDIVRIYSSTGASAETISVNESLFAPGNATPIATRSDTHSISNATFGAFGYPLAANGYDLVDTGELNIAGLKTIAAGREFVLQPGTNGSNSFCSDSAGYNATGFAKLGETFGWSGGVANGTRVVNSDGSVTWTATHAGTSDKGAIGSLSIVTGTQNTTCPIATPMFTLAGGTPVGSYAIPVVATFDHGMLESLTVTNATLANGDTLNVTTNAGQPASSSQFITGTLANGGAGFATFAIDAYGDGTLTLTATGAQFVITDWRVVR